MRSAPAPSARIRRVAATSVWISGLPPYLTFSTSPPSKTHSNFGGPARALRRTELADELVRLPEKRLALSGCSRRRASSYGCSGGCHTLARDNDVLRTVPLAIRRSSFCPFPGAERISPRAERSATPPSGDGTARAKTEDAEKAHDPELLDSRLLLCFSGTRRPGLRSALRFWATSPASGRRDDMTARADGHNVPPAVRPLRPSSRPPRRRRRDRADDRTLAAVEHRADTPPITAPRPAFFLSMRLS